MPRFSNLQLVPQPNPSAKSGSVEFVGDRAALVAALGRGEEGAAVALFDEYAELVERTAGRILGVDDELADVTQEIFVRALRSIHRIRDPQALTDWLIQIAVFTTRDWLRARKRKRWLAFWDPEQLEELDGRSTNPSSDADAREALRATYRVLGHLSIEERTAFALRYLDGMELTQIAAACDCSLATTKRRLKRASARFELLAQREPALGPWLDAVASNVADGKAT
ncbi:MAG: RNA polymerase sigma factor [Polyangiaceae bacterium]